MKQPKTTNNILLFGTSISIQICTDKPALKTDLKWTQSKGGHFFKQSEFSSGQNHTISGL